MPSDHIFTMGFPVEIRSKGKKLYSRKNLTALFDVIESGAVF